MLTRAAIVLLVVLNLAAAGWWWLHPAPPAEQPPAVPAGAARLHLASEPGAGAVPSFAAPPPAKPAPPPVANAAARSEAARSEAARSGPADAAPAPAAPVAANDAATPATACEGGRGAASGWRVYLPKLASVAAAQATATRIAEAGFSDYLVVRDGADANSIALGRYGSEAAAQRRVASLRAAGFAARCARIPPATPA